MRIELKQTPEGSKVIVLGFGVIFTGGRVEAKRKANELAKSQGEPNWFNVKVSGQVVPVPVK